MMNFFSAILDFIRMIWDAVVSTLDALKYLLEMITRLPSINSQLIMYTPSVISVSVAAVFAIGIAKLICGRN